MEAYTIETLHISGKKESRRSKQQQQQQQTEREKRKKPKRERKGTLLELYYQVRKLKQKPSVFR